jgi:hypothetical protein
MEGNRCDYHDIKGRELQTTPRPWRYEQEREHEGCHIYGMDVNGYICTTSGNALGDAKLIIKAVNEYDESQNRIELMTSFAIKLQDESQRIEKLNDELEAALKNILYMAETSGDKCIADEAKQALPKVESER